MRQKPGTKLKPPRTYEEGVANKLMGDLLGPPADRMRVLKYMKQAGYDDVLRAYDEWQAENSASESISPAVEQQIIEMAEKYLGPDAVKGLK